ncbi:MAG: glycosyltransferase [Rikenellaceae bacterium]
MKKLKVLFFVDRLRHGGIQTLFYEIIKNLTSVNMTIDVLILDDGQVYPLEQKLRDLGVQLYQLKGVWMRTPLDFLRYFAAVDNFFEEHNDYDVVHMHSGSKNYYILEAAAKHGVDVRVAHSHNTDFQSKNPLSKLLGDLMKRPLNKFATHKCGCSREACEWLFGGGSVERGEAQVVLNGVDSSLFAYNESTRIRIRQELNLDDKFVVGHVGRFENQKNHLFLIDIFKKIVAKRENSLLLLVGSGSLQPILEARVAELGLSEKVIFLGFRADRENILQAMDSFVFPSLYEGLPVTLVEAQISGLPLFVSSNVTQDLATLPKINYLPLSLSADHWADAILSSADYQRRDMSCEVKNVGFEVSTMVDNLYKMYVTQRAKKGNH